MSPSSSGLGYRVFIPAAGVQIPLGTEVERSCGLLWASYNGRVAQLGEHPAYIRKVTGSSPVSPNELLVSWGRGLVRSRTLDCHSRDRRFKSGRPRRSAEVAQSVEHRPEKAGVPSSNLGLGTILFGPVARICGVRMDI